MTFGPALIGIEIDGRLGNEGFSKDAATANSSGVGPAGSIAYGYSFKSDAGSMSLAESVRYLARR
jgi:hypothetical protein